MIPATPLPLRPGCAAECPSCRHRQWSKEASLAQKFDYLSNTLAPWMDVLQPIRSVDEAERWGYRSRVKLAARWTGTDWTFGLEPRDTFIPIPECPVQTPAATAAMRLLGKTLPPPEMFPLRYFIQNGSLATLLLKTPALPSMDWFNGQIAGELSVMGIRGLFVHLHPAAGRILFAKNGWRHIWGAQRARDGLGLWHGPGGFQQLLPSLYKQSLNLAEGFLNPAAGDAVIDLYSGSGASMSRWLGRGAEVIGVECDAEALECAARNAPGAALLRGLCAQRIPQLRDWRGERECLAYVNPPRLGLEAEVLSWLSGEAKPKRLAYLSCSAGTLRRDLHAMTAAGYAVTGLHPFDFFPQTHHVETLALLSLG